MGSCIKYPLLCCTDGSWLWRWSQMVKDARRVLRLIAMQTFIVLVLAQPVWLCCSIHRCLHHAMVMIQRVSFCFFFSSQVSSLNKVRECKEIVSIYIRIHFLAEWNRKLFDSPTHLRHAKIAVLCTMLSCNESVFWKNVCLKYHIIR